MGTIELKANIHSIVDGIQSEQLLHTIYDFLKIRGKSQPGQLWASLTEQQKQEVLLSYDESENEKYLIESEKIFKSMK